jgi:hypothetical protein
VKLFLLLPLLLVASCYRSSGELAELTTVNGTFDGIPVALEIERAQVTKGSGSVSVPVGAIATAATGGWSGIVSMVLTALAGAGVAGAATVRGKSALRDTLAAVVRGVETLRSDPTVAPDVDTVMRNEMSEPNKAIVRKIKAKAKGQA